MFDYESEIYFWIQDMTEISKIILEIYFYSIYVPLITTLFVSLILVELMTITV